MEAFVRELDELEETIVYLNLVFLVSVFVFFFFDGLIVYLAALAASLSFLAAVIAIALWVLRKVGSPLYGRLRGPERSLIRTLFTSEEKLPQAKTTEPL